MQLLNLAFDALALLLRQGVEGFRRHHRAVRNRREGKPGRRSDQGDVLRLRLLAQRLEGGLLAFAGAVLQRLATVAVILALEGGRYRRAQLVDQVAHRRLQRTALAGRQRQRPGLRSEEHTSELQSLMRISYAVFCLKKKN